MARCRAAVASGRYGEAGVAGAARVVVVVEVASEGALGFGGGRVAVVGALSRSSYMGFLSCISVG